MPYSITQTLSDQAYDQLKKNIMKYNAGDFISVREEAKKLGMSYTPVREAVQRLEQEGLLRLIPRVGYFIPKLDGKEINEIFQVRQCLEVFVFENVFSRLKEQHIEILQEYVREQRFHKKREGHIEFYKVDEKFHLLFFELYENSYLIEIITKVREKYVACTMRTILKDIQLDEAINEHEEIVEAIREKNKEKATRLMVQHIENAKTRGVKAEYV